MEENELNEDTKNLSEVFEKVKKSVKAGLDKKAYDILVIDIHKITSLTDFFVILSGHSQRHVKAIWENIYYKLKEEGINPLHIEGAEYANWVLIDYVDFVVHIFYEETRNYYSLEKLWAEGIEYSVKDLGFELSEDKVSYEEYD